MPFKLVPPPAPPTDADSLIRAQQIEDLGINKLLPLIAGGGVSLGVGYEALCCTYTEIASQFAVGEHALELHQRIGALDMGIHFLAATARKLQALKADLEEHGQEAVDQWQAAIKSQSALDKN